MKKLFSLLLLAALLFCCCSSALAEKHGLGIVTTINSSKNATADAAGVAQADTTVCSVILDDEGKILSIAFDVAQTKIAINDKGEITADLTDQVKTKKEMGDAYGMKEASAASGIGKEAYEQIEALENWCIGKTVEEAITKATAGDDADLLAGCTMHVDANMAALQKAADNAK